MPSTGNDIVSLALIDKERSNDSRFYLKFITPSEEALGRQVELAHLSFERYVWLCWSVKESVFKYLQRERPQMVFSPVKIVITNIIAPAIASETQRVDEDWEGDASGEENYRGSLTAEENTYYFRSKISASTIATIVSDDEKCKDVIWGISHIGQSNADLQSEQVRSFVLKRLQTFFPGKALHIEKVPAGYPVVMEGKKAFSLPVSFAHHGTTVSYSLLLAQPIEY
ncbi:MAG: 4'-phosphopantetheinyl transferase superfamily protein [Bacteroidota bacterium]